MKKRDMEITLAVMEGRESYRVLGKRYGVSYEAIRQAANRVCKAGLVEYYHKTQHVVVSPKKDFTREEMVRLRDWFVGIFRACWPELVEECGRPSVKKKVG